MTRKNAQPEQALQSRMATQLKERLHPDVEWTANAAGVRVAMTTARKMKAAGVRPGWPDLQFLCPDGFTRYVEVKPGKSGSLSEQQKDFRDACLKRRPDLWAVARSVDELFSILTDWGVPMREPLPPHIGGFLDGL